MPRYVNPADFGARFGPDVSRAVTNLLISVKSKAADTLVGSIRLPVGSGRDRHPGQLASTLGIVKESGLTSNQVGFGTPYGAVINRGRKRSKPYSYHRGGTAVQVPRGRMLGSLQTGRGRITGKAIRQLRESWEKLVEEAAAGEGGE